MGDELGNSFKDVLTGLKNVASRLFLQFPFMFVVVIAIVGFAFYQFTESEQKMTFALCILISFVSFLIYVKSNNYAETLLSFMLGVLTIFTITWDAYTSKLFVAFYVGINIFIFFASSIKLAMKVETELTTASSYIDIKNFKRTYKQLKEVYNVPTKYRMLAPLERAETIKFLAYMKVPLKEMADAIKSIELIKVVYQIDLKNSVEFFKTLYFIKRRSQGVFNIVNLLNLIVEKRLPLNPEEFLTVLNQTKKEIIQGSYSIADYLDIIEECVLNGEDTEGIISRLRIV